MVYAKSTKSKLRLSLKGNEVAFLNATLPKHEVNYSSEAKITLGNTTTVIPKTQNKEEFITQINNSNILNCTDTGVWKISPVNGEYGVSGDPINVYESTDGIRRRITKDGNNYTLRDVSNLNIEEPHVHILPGGDVADGYKYLNGTFTKHILGETICVDGSNIVLEHAKIAGKKQHISSDKNYSKRLSSNTTLSLVQNEFFVTKNAINSGRFVIPLWEQNEGLIVNSQCNFTIVKNDKVNQPLFSFRTRIDFQDVKHASIVNPLPVECKELSVELRNGKVEVWGLTAGNRQKLLQGDVTIPSDCRFCIHAVADCEIDAIFFQKLVDVQNDAASLCLAIETPASSTFNILTSDTTTLFVVTGQLIVNGVSTGIVLATNTQYVISCGYVSSEQKIDVSALTMSNSALQQYESSQAEPNFSANYPHASDPVFMQHGGKLGEVIWTFQNNSKLEKQILACVLASHWAPRVIDLGTPNPAGVFSNGGLFNKSDDTFTHNTIVYNRIVPKISRELQHIFGCVEDIFGCGEIIGTKKPFDERIHSYDVKLVGSGIRNTRGENLLFNGTAHDLHLQASQPEYFPIVYQGACNVLFFYVDAATGQRKLMRGAGSSSVHLKVR